jgi:hypothetical protein
MRSDTNFTNHTNDPTTDLSLMRFVTIRVIGVFVAIVTCVIACGPSDAQEPSPVEQKTGSLSPDKKWQYNCGEYAPGYCYPEIVKAGTTERAVDLDQELSVNGPEARDAEIMWAPDSKRFGFNYSPPHAHHTRFQTVAFYQLRGDKWVALRQPPDYLLRRRSDHLPKGFNPRQCVREWDELKLREWTDANTAILYAPCHGRSSDLPAAFLLTLKFDDAGNWKIIKAHQMSKKELAKEQ